MAFTIGANSELEKNNGVAALSVAYNEGSDQEYSIDSDVVTVAASSYVELGELHGVIISDAADVESSAIKSVSLQMRIDNSGSFEYVELDSVSYSLIKVTKSIRMKPKYKEKIPAGSQFKFTVVLGRSKDIESETAGVEYKFKLKYVEFKESA